MPCFVNGISTLNCQMHSLHLQYKLSSAAAAAAAAATANTILTACFDKLTVVYSELACL
jgi:hypothetical protein